MNSRKELRSKLEMLALMAFLAVSFHAQSAKAHTMRAVAPDSIQISAPTLPSKNIDEDDTPDDIEFDDDFSVLV